VLVGVGDDPVVTRDDPGDDSWVSGMTRG